MDQASLSRRLALALDTPDRETAEDLVWRTRDHVGIYKVGLELFCAAGPSFVKWLRRQDVEVFVDLKLHDIPNTVSGAVRALGALGVSWVTLHGLGGMAMLSEARGALGDQTIIPGFSGTRLLAVTILTHHTGRELASLGLQGDAEESVLRLIGLAREAGLDGCVCSPEEVRAVRELAGPDFQIVCPGIRPQGAPLGDQARSATPYEAIREGADILVVGRPIHTAPDPEAAAAEILQEIERGLKDRKKGS